MTLPEERFRALEQAKQFLLELLDPKATPRVPYSVRLKARVVLRHFPWDSDLDVIASKIPERFKRESR